MFPVNIHSATPHVVILLIFVILGISTVYRGAYDSPKRTDLTVYLTASEAVLSGEHIYEARNERDWLYVYLPLLSILLVPFTFLPLPLTVFIWYLFSILAWIGSYWITQRLSLPRDYVLAAFLLSLLAFLDTIARGQMGVLLVGFALGVYLLHTRGRDLWAGLALALAVTFKVTPLLILVFYFLFKRRWKTLTGFGLGMVLFAVLIPSLLIGWEKNLEYLVYWHKSMTLVSSDHAWDSPLWDHSITPFASDNQSLYAILTRYVYKEESAFFGQTNWIVRWINVGFLAVALFSLALISHRKKTREVSFAEFSLYPMLMLFTSPASQINHYTFLFLLILGGLITRRKFAVSLAAAAYLCGMAFSPINKIGLPFWGAVYLWFSVQNALWENKKEHLTA